MNAVPRVVLVTRPSDYEALVARHGTRSQAAFFLGSRGRSIEEVETRHHRQEAAVRAVVQAIPAAWRRIHLSREDLAQFVFEPGDIVAAVGQDGLVANVAKYLSGQPVIGVNPDPEWYPGVLVPHPPKTIARVIAATAEHRCRVQARTMVEARLDDGERLLALNEIFVGQVTHQSARYVISACGESERQSSSGLIVSTGTGATGWALSIHTQLGSRLPLPRPEDPRLAFFVREPWPSVATGTSLTSGLVDAGAPLEVVSEMNEGGTLFGDGIEQDRVQLGFGMSARIGVAEERLQLVTGVA